MLYKTAAYVYLVALTITLLITTSQAEFEINKGRNLVRKLFNKFIRITLEKQSKNLNGLIKTANSIVEDENFQKYLVYVASHGSYCQVLTQIIDGYDENFRKLLKGVEYTEGKDDFLKGVKYTEGKDDSLRIPMFSLLKSEILSYLKRGCKYQPGTSSHMELIIDPKASFALEELMDITNEADEDITLEQFFAEEEDDEVLMPPVVENATDEFGFKINKGIKEVKMVLDKLLQLVLKKSCHSLTNLIDFADSMVKTVLYQAVLDAVPTHREDLLRYINEYIDNFWSMLVVLGDTFEDDERVPILDILYTLRAKCRTYFGDWPSHTP